MAISEIKIIEKLEQKDQEKVSYFIRLLLHQSKYQTLKKEIAHRREEIAQGKTLTHEAMPPLPCRATTETQSRRDAETQSMS